MRSEPPLSRPPLFRRTLAFVDNDRELLARAAASGGQAQSLETRAVDLATGLASPDLFADRDLVTASALRSGVRGLAARAGPQVPRCAGRCAVCADLQRRNAVRAGRAGRRSRSSWSTFTSRLDKGFGPALGPGAAEAAARAFDEMGYEVWRAVSDWELGPDSTRLQVHLIEGWTESAEAIAPERAALLRDWQTRRLSHVEAGRSRVVVGHEDMAGWL